MQVGLVNVKFNPLTPFKVLLQDSKSVDGIANSLIGISFRMLGFQGGTFTRESRFGRVPDDFIMDNVHCIGTEKDIR